MRKHWKLILGLALPLAANPGALYGPGIQADSLANTPIGKGGVQVSCRFRAQPGGVFQGIRPYLIWSFAKKGYHGGTGGNLKVELQADDGSPAHRPSGQVLATTAQRMTLVPTSSRFFPQLTFDQAPALKPGALYHLVFTNVDADPEANFVSLNACYNKVAGSPQQPRLADGDWAMLFRSRRQAAWVERRTPGSSESFTPILQVEYANGQAQGMGYVEFWMGAAKPISGPASVREVFTVTGPNRAVGSVAVRVRRVAGAIPLGLTLEQADGKVVAVGQGEGSLIPQTPPGALGGCGWVVFALPGRPTLVAGRTYHLVLSAPAAGAYEAFPLRKGSDKGFSDATLFPDGHAEFTDGRGWSGWEQWGKKNQRNADLQFYFKLIN